MANSLPHRSWRWAVEVIGRRALIAGGALAAAGCAGGAQTASELAKIEAMVGGRLGVFAIDSRTGAILAHRPNERFAMCSTFKWLLAAAVLKACESEQMLRLDLQVTYTRAQLLPNSPTSDARIDPATGQGEMTIEQLCEAAVVVSDNCAANLLLEGMIAPAGLTRFIRQTGDDVTRLDRRELDLNENAPNDPRDTTTPEAMARSMLRILGGPDVLNAASRKKLIGWLIAEIPGLNRLRAGLPRGWPVGDKPGTGGNGAFNDVAICWPPDRGPIVIASFMSESSASNEAKAAAQGEVARLIVKRWG